MRNSHPCDRKSSEKNTCRKIRDDGRPYSLQPPLIHKYFYLFFTDLRRRKISGSKFSGRKMVEIVITVCELLGPAAAILIGITLLGIALEKISV